LGVFCSYGLLRLRVVVSSGLCGHAIATGDWQTLTTVAGDGTRKQVTDTAGAAQRFYRVATQ